MPRPTRNVTDRIELYRAAWRELAPETSFAGMTLEQFEGAVSTVSTLQSEITVIGTQLDAKKAEKSIAERATNELLELVVNSVRGTPGFGADCALYRAFGYVRKSERKSGLTRKGTGTAEADAA
jgi:hypothetical protein